MHAALKCHTPKHPPYDPPAASPCSPVVSLTVHGPECRTECGGTSPSSVGTCRATVSVTPGYAVAWPVPLTAAVSAAKMMPNWSPETKALVDSSAGRVMWARPER